MWRSRHATRHGRGGRKVLSACALGTVLVTGVWAVSTSALATAATVSGNNGTIKIHEKGTPSGTESNDPNACVFNVEGLGLDAGQTGYLVFNVQGGDGPTGTNAGPYDFGPANAQGYYATPYFNLDPGHYKATLYGKMLPGGKLTDIKAKSKVFKVSCASTPPPPVAPEPYGNIGNASCIDGVLTVPVTYGVKGGGSVAFSVDDSDNVAQTDHFTTLKTLKAGQTDTVNVALTASSHDHDVVLYGDRSVLDEKIISAQDCNTPPPAQHAAAVTFTEGSGACVNYQPSYTKPSFPIPVSDVADYYEGETKLAPGQHEANFGDTVTIVAKAKTDVPLTGQTTWTHTFGDQPVLNCEKPQSPPNVTVTPHQATCTCASPSATVTTDATASIGYANSPTATPTWVKHEAKAGTYTLNFPALQLGGTSTWYIVVSPTDDSAKLVVKGPFTFNRPTGAQCATPPPVHHNPPPPPVVTHPAPRPPVVSPHADYPAAAHTDGFTINLGLIGLVGMLLVGAAGIILRGRKRIAASVPRS